MKDTNFSDLSLAGILDNDGNRSEGTVSPWWIWDSGNPDLTRNNSKFLVDPPFLMS